MPIAVFKYTLEVFFLARNLNFLEIDVIVTLKFLIP